MSGRALLVGLLGCLACAHRPPPPPAETFAPTNDTPPPRGQPPPRGGEIPLPPPNPGGGPPDTFEQQQRFPAVQGEARREARQREKLQAAGDVELQPGAPPAEVCGPLAIEDRVSCPLHAAAIEEVRDVPGGVVIRMHAGKISAPRLTRALACQRALAQASPRERPLCPYLDTATTARVVQSGSHLEVHVTRAGDVDRLREQAHALIR
jgi:hypothetical protein